MIRKTVRRFEALIMRGSIRLCLFAFVVPGEANAVPVDASGSPVPPVSGSGIVESDKTKITAIPARLGPSPEAPVKVNRTVPKVEPPETSPRFSTSPAIEEFFRVRVFEEPLVPIGGEPTPAENAALAAALTGYAKRSGPDDFSRLTGFLEKHPGSAWRAALLTNLGTEYYNTAHYSKTLEVWTEAWKLSKDASDPQGKAIADRAAGELALMLSRLGRMTELDAMLKSVEGRVFLGAATERISGAREALWSMQNKPEIAFRCGPMALHRIKRSVDPKNAGTAEIVKSASSQKGFSLPQVNELSAKIGLHYQMAFREKGGALVVPSVVHWKVGHYAALIRQEGDRYLLEDPAFGNDVRATKETLDAETTGYFLIPAGKLLEGWRTVDEKEGASVWGKGLTGGSSQGDGAPKDPKTKWAPCKGMAVSSVHLMLVSLNIRDEPVGYSPPVGPEVRFTVTYNQREAFQPANFAYSNFGAKWTCDWISYITDNPQSLLADAKYFVMGGGTRTFTGFDTATQSYESQQFDQTRLTRTGLGSYQMMSRDGSMLIFGRPDGSVGTSRKVFLTQIVDPFGNTVTLTYDGSLRLVAVADAIGQVTTLSYAHPTDMYKITRVTDPFGRFATFGYDASSRLNKITDVIGIASQFTYEGTGDFINSLVTPYGTTSFTRLQSGGANGTTRALETLYPDGTRDRVEYNQYAAVPDALPASSVPTGMATYNQYHVYRNTYYWSRQACATGYGDYSKARIYHWLHTPDFTTTAGILESTKAPLEGRVWYDYAGQMTAHSVGPNNRPSHAGRVLDDGSTQLYSYTYDGFGHVTSSTDPLGRKMSYVYAANGIDLLEVRQTRAGNNELLSRTTYNSQHLPLTQTDAAGQTATHTYNARGQILNMTNPKNEITSYTYDSNGYLVTVDGPLPGTTDVVTATYDSFGRAGTKTDESGYTLTFNYDALDRLTRVTHPDGTFSEYVFDLLDVVAIQDRAGRQTFMEYDAMRQMTKRTDPLGRVTRFQWCSCGDLGSLTDPMGRTTAWYKDVQGRLTRKQYGDGTRVSYFYENASSRLQQIIDEKHQTTQFSYNRDGTLRSTTYANSAVPTPGVSYTYDPNYERIISMTDGTGTTYYSYHPITAAPILGAGSLASVDGPLPNDTIAYAYDELGRRVSTAINGVASVMIFDAAGRVAGETNALGSFSRTYDGASHRMLTHTFPNGQMEERGYAGNLQDRSLQRITHKRGATPISEFIYGRDVATDRITTWSQQAGAQSPQLHSFGYDAADQLLSATVTDAGTPVNTFAYTYDLAGNRLTEQAGPSSYTASYNALNQISVSTAPGSSRTSEWDARDRLVAVNIGNQRTEFTYDGEGRRVSIRQLTDGSQVLLRRFVWCGGDLCEERDSSGGVTKRFFPQGMKIEMGTNAGIYFYTLDHLGSIRELTDSGGGVRARYSYDPYGRRTRVSGDIEADFGFAGMFWSPEAGLFVTNYRGYDPESGRWLSRDPLPNAEMQEGPNLYLYVGNNVLNLVDPLGLAVCCKNQQAALLAMKHFSELSCRKGWTLANQLCAGVKSKIGDPHATELLDPDSAQAACHAAVHAAGDACRSYRSSALQALQALAECILKNCKPPCPAPPGPIVLPNADDGGE